MFRNYVSAQDGPQNCKACRQVFKEVWDENKEKWLLDQAAKIKYEQNNIENCLIDSDDKNEDSSSQKYDLMHFNCFKLLFKNQHSP